MASRVSGLAASIRSASESETFDLAGQSESTISSTISDAFSDPPYPLNDMIRITFITGAGKLGRQKYGDGTPKAVTSALRKLGFEEDRGASCVAECGGSFKLQHDTGKNLKTVVVFPRIDNSNSGGDSNLEDDMGAMNMSTLLPSGSPEHLIAMSSKTVFEKMLDNKCPSWAQKKGCLSAISSVKELLQSFDDKLLSGKALADAEQDFYDSLSLDALGEKEIFVKKRMQEQVEAENVTRLEKDFLTEQVKNKIEALESETAEAEEKKKPKKAEKLKIMSEKLKNRQKKLLDIKPKALRGLKFDPEISKLMVEMRPLQKIEDSAKGRLLTLKETTLLSRKDDILERMQELEESSRGWFESDDAFDLRLEASRAAHAEREKRFRKKASAKSSSSSSSGNSYKVKTASWATPSMSRTKTQVKKPKGGTGGGGVFAQMMMDSDSD